MQHIKTPRSRAIPSRLALVTAAVLLLVSLTRAQQPTDTPTQPTDAQTQPIDATLTPAEMPQAKPGTQRRQFSWNFDKDPVKGWHFACQHLLLPTQSGRALQLSNGHAIWNPVGEISDFVLQFRYGYENGSGDVFFRISPTPEGEECYALKLAPDSLTLVSRLNQPTDEGYPEDELVSKRGVLKPKKWYAITIRAVGGQIDVLVGGQKALSYRDPKPLTTGTLGLGAAGTSVVLYDNVVLTAVVTPPSAPKPMKASTFTWP